MKFVKMTRRMAFTNLKRSLSSLHFIKHGRESGYPPCCIAYYWVRAVSMELWAIVFGNLGFFYLPKHERIRLATYQGPRHILCWFHKIVYRNKPMVYHMCEPCGWLQFQKKECNKCGVSHE